MSKGNFASAAAGPLGDALKAAESGEQARWSPKICGSEKGYATTLRHMVEFVSADMTFEEFAKRHGARKLVEITMVAAQVGAKNFVRQVESSLEQVLAAIRSGKRPDEIGPIESHLKHCPDDLKPFRTSCKELWLYTNPDVSHDEYAKVYGYDRLVELTAFICAEDGDYIFEVLEAHLEAGVEEVVFEHPKEAAR